MKKNNILMIMLIILVVVIGGCLMIKVKQEKDAEFTYCKRRIYEFDEIAKGCDKYFKNESWYKTYIKEVEKNYKNLK